LQQLSGTVGTFGDRASVLLVVLDLLVVVALNPALLTSLYRRIAPMAVGSSGAEGLPAARLTSSLEHSTLIAPTILLTPSVQPVLHSFFT